MQNLGTLDNQYIILSFISDDGDSKYYAARNNQMNINYIIAIKRNSYHDNNNDFPAKEINILNILHNVNNPYILHFIRNENGLINLQNKKPRNVAYLVFESADLNFSLFDYMILGRFQERHAKLIFKKILSGIQAIHDANICHRDINPYNIIFDDNYNPKIFYFGFCCLNSNNLQEEGGNRQFAPPEVFSNKPYNGFKYDIFSLGQLLFYLVTGNLGFNSSLNDDIYYARIINHQYDEYWKLVLPPNLNLSYSFKNLSVRMVAYNPNERPTIEQILNYSWMQEINNLNDEDRNILENQVVQELQNRRNNLVNNQQIQNMEDEENQDR